LAGNLQRNTINERINMLSSPITTSIFDLFKVGPGPSSSHTIGPMKAAFDFRQRLAQLPNSVQTRASTIHIYLYGSLSATGKGHGTDRAVVAGLLGWQPETTDPDALMKLLHDPTLTYPIQAGNQPIAVGPQHIHFERKRYESPYANTLVLTLNDGKEILAQEEYYSIGGGFILRKGEAETEANAQQVPYPYSTMTELKAQLTASALSLDELLMANEMALTGRSRAEVNQRIDQLLDFMHKAVRRGLRQKGILPGTDSVPAGEGYEPIFRQFSNLPECVLSGRVRGECSRWYCCYGSHIGGIGCYSGTDVPGPAPFSLQKSYHAKRDAGGRGYWFSGET
jgi:L-serine dehydratase